MGAESSSLVDSRGVKYSKRDVRAVTAIQAIARMRSAKKKLGNERKWKRHRERVLKELLSTETTYVSNLEGLVDLYVHPLRENKMISNTEHRTLFSNVEKILALHRELYEKLIESTVVPGTMPDIRPGPRPSFDASRISYDGPSNRNSVEIARSVLKNHPEQNQIQLLDDAMSSAAECFSQIAPQLKIYTEYVNNYDNALKLLGKFSGREKISSFFQKCKENPASGGLDLSSLLITPIQRIPRYQLLMQDMLKHSDEKNPHTKLFNRALNSIKEVAKYVNEMKREAESLMAVLAVQKTLRTIGQGRNLVKAKRRIIKEGNLIHFVGNKQKNRCCILFNDLVLLVSANVKKLGGRKIHFEMNTTGMKLDSSKSAPALGSGMAPPPNDVIFALTNDQGVSAIFQCVSASEKEIWTNEVQRALNDTIERDVRKALDESDRLDLSMTYPLHCAAALDMIDSVKAFLCSGSKVSQPDSNGLLPIHHAAASGSIEIASTLVESGSNIYALDSSGASVFHYAAQEGNEEIISWFVDRTEGKGFVDAKTEDNGETAVIRAARRGHSNSLIALSKNGANFTLVDNSGKSALHHAVLNGKTSCCGVLCELNRKMVNLRDKYGRTALHYAIMKTNLNTVPLLIRYGANLNCMSSDGGLPVAIVLSRLVQIFLNKDVTREETEISMDCSLLEFMLMHGARFSESDLLFINSGRMKNSEDVRKLIDDSTGHWQDRNDLDVREPTDDLSNLITFVLPERYEGLGDSTYEDSTVSLTERRVNASSAEILENLISSKPLAEPCEWVPDSVSKSCQMCEHPFSFFSRRHHCRYCGSLVCSECSKNRIRLKSSIKGWEWVSSNSSGDRLCNGCYNYLKWRSGGLGSDIRDLSNVYAWRNRRKNVLFSFN